MHDARRAGVRFPHEGALLGVLFDTDSEVALPGAIVVARWTIDGDQGRAETGTSIDGSFTLCQVPLETEISLLGIIGTVPGQAVAITLTDPVTRQDVAISLAGPMGGGGEKMLACLGPPDSEFRLRVGDLVHCDPGWPGLERCPREELGRVSVPESSAPSRGPRFSGEAIQRLIAEAEKLGANALINYRVNGGLILAEAVLIEVDPASC